MASPSDLLLCKGQWNLRLLETGWPDIDVDSEGFP